MKARKAGMTTPSLGQGAMCLLLRAACPFGAIVKAVSGGECRRVMGTLLLAIHAERPSRVSAG